MTGDEQASKVDREYPFDKNVEKNKGHKTGPHCGESVTGRKEL